MVDVEQRLVELETRAAYQEDSLRVLSDALAAQQKEIERLTAFGRELLERIKSQAQGRDTEWSEAEQRPPHY